MHPELEELTQDAARFRWMRAHQEHSVELLNQAMNDPVGNLRKLIDENRLAEGHCTMPGALYDGHMECKEMGGRCTCHGVPCKRG